MGLGGGAPGKIILVGAAVTGVARAGELRGLVRTNAVSALHRVGVHANIITASILAVLSAVRRAHARGLLPAQGKAVGA